LLGPEKEEWFCSRCHVSYFPNKGKKVKRANKFETPSREDNFLVSIVDDSPKPKDSMPRHFREGKAWAEKPLGKNNFKSQTIFTLLIAKIA
jgi:hypothetical protein